MKQRKQPPAPWQWALSLASFLLGLGSILWWQRSRDERLLHEMEETPGPRVPVRERAGYNGHEGRTD